MKNEYTRFFNRLAENLQGLAGQLQLPHQKTDDQKTRQSIVQGVMPPASGQQGIHGRTHSEGIAQGGQGIIRQSGNAHLPQNQSIQPGTKSVSRKSPQELPLRGRIVARHHGAAQPGADIRPQRMKRRSVRQHLRGDAVYL